MDLIGFLPYTTSASGRFWGRICKAAHRLQRSASKTRTLIPVVRQVYGTTFIYLIGQKIHTRLGIIYAAEITCWCGSAKRSVTDGCAFLREPRVFRHRPSQNPSSDRQNFCKRLTKSIRSSNVLNIIGMGW